MSCTSSSIGYLFFTPFGIIDALISSLTSPLAFKSLCLGLSPPTSTTPHLHWYRSASKFLCLCWSHLASKSLHLLRSRFSSMSARLCWSHLASMSLLLRWSCSAFMAPPEMSSFRLHRAPLSLRLSLCQSLLWLHHKLPGLWIAPHPSTSLLGSSFPPAPPQSSVPSVPPHPSDSTSGTRHHGSALPSWSSGIAWSLCPSDSAWISTFPVFTSFGWAHDSTLAPLSISSTVGHPPPGPDWGRPIVSSSNYSPMNSSSLNSPWTPPWTHPQSFGNPPSTFFVFVV